MKSKRPRAARDALRQAIRAAGLRCTPARLTVLAELHRAARPTNHAELATLLEPSGFDRATVYRNLIDLSEAGLVSRIDLGDHVWRFEVRNPDAAHNDEHPHFVCTECGEVSCLPGVEVNITPAPGSKRSSLGHVTEVLLKGRCVDCK